MTAGWKAVYHSVVRLQNEMEWMGKFSEPASLVLDKNYWSKYIDQWDRVRRREDRRKAKGVKLEWRLTWDQVRKEPGQIIAEARIHRKRTYTIGDAVIHEERMDRENIHFVQNEGQWQLLRIIPERPEQAGGDEVQRAVQPYLHPAVQTGWMGRQSKYDRAKVKAYADRWWNGANPEYIHFSVDCTNFVSQCLYAGSRRMDYTNERDSGWWYRHPNQGWSYSWSVAHSLRWYLAHPSHRLKATEKERADQLEIGDVILYDWNGDGNYQHSVIVAAKDPDGQPLVNAHTADSKHRYWDYKDSYAWSDQTRYRFFHIADDL